jgi:hypothetical protein
MPNLDEKVSAAAEQLLKRQLTDEERLEIYRISDVLGMKDVQSFLHLILVFKLHEDTMREGFGELAALEKKINDTLENSIERVLGDGAARIGADMGGAVAAGAKKTLTSFGEYHSIRGQVILACFICVISSLAYWLGTANVLRLVPEGGTLEALLFLPGGWSVFFGGTTYTFLWIGDHWDLIRKTALFKIILGLQILVWSILALTLL